MTEPVKTKKMVLVILDDLRQPFATVLLEKLDFGYLTFTIWDTFDAAAEYVEKVLQGTNIRNNHNGSLTYDSVNILGDHMYTSTLSYKGFTGEGLLDLTT